MSCMTIFFYKQVQISRSDIRPHIKWAVSLVILHKVTSIFLQGLCGYIWVNILTLSPRRGLRAGDEGMLTAWTAPIPFNNIGISKSMELWLATLHHSVRWLVESEADMSPIANDSNLKLVLRNGNTHQQNTFYFKRIQFLSVILFDDDLELNKIF